MATAFKDHMTVITDADELELAWQEQERLQAESAPAPAGDLLGGGSALDDVGQFFKIEGNLDDA
jgi:hypothetical protein